jgi:hypothetical protein
MQHEHHKPASFHSSPQEAMQAPPEEFLYLACLDQRTEKPDFLAVVDAEEGTVVHELLMPNVGDELHHFGWDRCSSACHGPDRSHLILPGFRSSRIHEELRGTGVRVTAVAPGVTDTGFADVAGSHHPESRLPHLQSGRVVRAALRAHDRGRTLKVVGAFYVVLTIAGRFTPRAVLRRMMGRLWRPPSSSRSARLRLPRGDRGLGSQQTTRDE